MSITYFKNLQAPGGDKGAYDRIGQIIAVRYIDDELNISKKYIEYDVLAIMDQGSRATLKNVRAIHSFSGLNDFEYRVLEENQFSKDGPLDGSTPPQNQNGTYVVIGFINGNYFLPYIKGSLDHPGLEGLATKDLGQHSFETFKGFEKTINKDGELSLSYNGATDVQGQLIDKSEVPVTLKIGKTDDLGEDNDPSKSHSMILFKDGMSLTFKDGTSLTINSTDSSISILQKDGHKIDIKSDGISVADKDGAKLEIKGGSLTVTDSGGATINVDGGGVTAKDSSGGTLKLSSGKVGLGGSAAEIVDLFSQLTQLLATEAPAGFGSPLVNAAQYAMLQAKADSIKGGI